MFGRRATRAEKENKPGVDETVVPCSDIKIIWSPTDETDLFVTLVNHMTDAKLDTIVVVDIYSSQMMPAGFPLQSP